MVWAIETLHVMLNIFIEVMCVEADAIRSMEYGIDLPVTHYGVYLYTFTKATINQF